MAVESAEQRREYLTFWRTTATVTPAASGVASPPFPVVRENAFSESPIAGAVIGSSAPSITAVVEDWPADADEGDPVDVETPFGLEFYRVKTPKPDGTGMIRVDLDERAAP